jgi:hypothetical protein
MAAARQEDDSKTGHPRVARETRQLELSVFVVDRIYPNPGSESQAKSEEVLPC